MGTTLLCAAVVLVGVKFSTQPLPGGGIEYVIQIEPLALESLRAGSDIRSDIPPTLGDLRSFRITTRTDPALAGQPPPDLSAGGQQKAVAPALPTDRAASPGQQPGSAVARGTMFPPTPQGLPPLPRVDLGGQALASPDPRKKPQEPRSASPSLFPSPTDVKPLGEQKAAFLDSGKGLPSAAATPPAEPKKTPLAPAAASDSLWPNASPALLLSLAATTVGSLGGMMFFGWVAWDYRNRYRRLLHRVHGAGEPGPAHTKVPLQ